MGIHSSATKLSNGLLKFLILSLPLSPDSVLSASSDKRLYMGEIQWRWEDCLIFDLDSFGLQK